MQEYNLKLKERVSCLEDKTVQLEIKNNSLEQYGWRKKLGIEETPTSISDDELEKTDVDTLNSINVNLSSSDIETRHRIGKSKDGKPMVIRIVNSKFYKKTLLKKIVISYYK